MDQQFRSCLDELRAIVCRNQDSLSGQLMRRITTLIEESSDNIAEGKSQTRIVRKIAAIFQRLILELIQSHYNTRQREDEFRRLVESKGCAIIDPAIMDDVIEILVKLYRAGQDCADLSFERSVLTRFIMRELNNTNLTLGQLKKTIQTLYRCSCFDVVKKENKETNELKLKPHLRDANTLSLHCDEELIKIAQDHQIRLSPESWAHLLHKNRPNVSRMQSILDRCQTTPTVSELKKTITLAGDRYSLSSRLIDLRETQDLLSSSMAVESNQMVGMESITNLMKKLLSFEDLYAIRQNRNTYFRR